MSDIDLDGFGEDRKPTKREIERWFASYMMASDIKGNVLTLTGPAFEEHFNNYGPILTPRSRFVVCEENWDVFHNRIFPIAKRLMANDRRIVPKYKDVMKEILTPPNEWGWAVSDLDFCETLDTLVNERGLLDACDILARNRVLRSRGACVIITACMRSGERGDKFDVDLLRSMIPHIFEKHGYVVSNVLGPRRYKDVRGPPMCTILYHLHRYNVKLTREEFDMKWNLPARVVA